MKKLNILFALLLPLSLFGQQKVEIGGFLGFANYQGDLSRDDIEISETKLSLGGFVRYHLTDKVKLRANGFLGFISGSDANDQKGSLRERGWSFKSNIFELSMVGEYHPLGKKRIGDTGIFERQVSPYIFVGAGMVQTSPAVTVTKMEDENLFPEQGFESTALSIPFGLGVRADLFDFVSLGFEAGWRTTSNDYLDGVKQNGNPNKKDLYMFVGTTLSFFFGTIEGYEF
ncbi:MAG TPA: hypothetical protein ENJ95_09855 [Bacteroidetes bacterium]|nr:hypothetical protein [Bacteroidota bacterium]